MSLITENFVTIGLKLQNNKDVENFQYSYSCNNPPISCECLYKGWLVTVKMDNSYRMLYKMECNINGSVINITRSSSSAEDHVRDFDMFFNDISLKWLDF